MLISVDWSISKDITQFFDLAIDQAHVLGRPVWLRCNLPPETLIAEPPRFYKDDRQMDDGRWQDYTVELAYSFECVARGVFTINYLARPVYA